MKLIRLGLLIFIFAAGAQAAPEAILTGVKGAVQVVQGGHTKTGKNGDALDAGAVVRVGANGGATVYYANRPPQSLKANQQVQVTAPGTRTQPSVWINVYKGVAAGFARRGEKVGGTVRGDENAPFARDDVIPLSPVNSRVLQRPVLSWVLTDAPGPFEVTLRDANAKVLWQAKTTQLSTTVPPQIPLATGAKYYWRVSSCDANGNEKDCLDSWFEIAPDAEIIAVQQEQAAIADALKAEDAGTVAVAQAAALGERGFYDAAIALLSKKTLENGVAQGASQLQVRAALKSFNALLASLDDAARWQLRKLYADTGQIELANFIAPDLPTGPLPSVENH
jgi:hypothetical protein